MLYQRGVSRGWRSLLQTLKAFGTGCRLSFRPDLLRPADGECGFRKRIVETGPAYGRTVPAIRLCGRSLGQLRSFRERKPSGHTEVRRACLPEQRKDIRYLRVPPRYSEAGKAAGRFPPQGEYP